MEYDLHSNVKGVNALNAAAITTNTTTVGNIVDTLDFESLEYFIQSGTVTDGVYTLLIQEGDDPGLSDVTNVPADETLGALTGFVAFDDDTIKRVGSIGKKRYQRLSIVSTGVTTGANFMGSTAALSNQKTSPVAEQ